MSNPDDELPQISAAEGAYMEANINGTLLFNFLMGMYTLVYFGTLRLYYSKSGPIQQRRIVVSTITILYLMCTCTFALDWYWLKYAIINNGQTQISMFNAIVEAPPWVYITLVVLQFGMFIISDGLLIWRCFYVWDRSFRVILVPSIFLVAEIGISIATIFTAFKVPKFVADLNLAGMENTLQSTGLFTSFATTVVTNFLIGYRIYSAIRPVEGAMITMGRRFEHITKSLVESAAVYAVVILVNAVFEVAPYDLGSNPDIGSIYAGLLLPITGGMAPTVIVARTAMAGHNSTQESTVAHISALHFQTQPNLADEGEIQSRFIGSGNVHILPDPEAI